MLIWLTLLVFLLLILFFLSGAFVKKLHLLVFRLAKNQEASIHGLTWLLLPGTIIHELSHLFMAELLRVRTGELSFKPEIREGNEVRAGGLKIAKTGPLRHSLIGLAPIMAGITTLTVLSYFVLFPLLEKIISRPFSPANYRFFILNSLFLLFLGYFFSVVSSTMFSSKKDLETIVFPLLIIALIVGVFWLGNIQLSLPAGFVIGLTQLLRQVDLALISSIIVDFLFLSFIKLLLAIS